MNLFMDVFLNICTLLSGYLALWKLLDMCCWRHFCRRW